MPRLSIYYFWPNLENAIKTMTFQKLKIKQTWDCHDQIKEDTINF